VKYKKYIICDEASELEDELVKQFSVNIDVRKLRSNDVIVDYLQSESRASIKKWINTIHTNTYEILEDLKSKKKSSLTQRDIYKLQYLTSVYQNTKTVIENWGSCDYILQIDSKDDVRLTPLRVDKLTRCIFDHADKIVLMSATIIDHANLAKSLGIDDYKYIESPSSFDPKKAPIFVSQKNRLNYKNIDKSLPIVVSQIKKICEKHKNDKGIIHTHTNKITGYIKNNISDPRFLFRDDAVKNEHILELHNESPDPTVLVSPSLGLGVDLKDDLARFQIIVKASYLPLGDNRIKKMFELDKQWYTDKMLSNFIQQCGRGIRSEDDFCITYVLDACIFDAIVRNKNKLPKYFIERFL